MPKLVSQSRTAPLPLPNESGPLPIFHLVKARLGRRSSVHASVCERNTGKGKVELRKSAKRHRNARATADAPSSYSLQRGPASSFPNPERKNKYHRRHWLFGLHRADADVSLSVNVRDTEHGTVNMKLSPSKKINISVHLKRLITVPSFNDSLSLASRVRNLLVLLPPCVKQAKHTSTGQLLLHHELEYKWKGRFVSALYSLEAFRHMVSLRVRNNPLRITPKLQAPLWAGGQTAPCLIWEREPNSGPGELQLLRKPFKISYEFQRRRVGMYHLSQSGSISRLSFDTESIQIEQTMTHLLKGALITTTSTLSSRVNSTGVMVSAIAPWGKISAHGRPRSAFIICSDALFDYPRQRQIRARVQAENLSHVAVRLGFFY